MQTALRQILARSLAVGALGPAALAQATPLANGNVVIHSAAGPRTASFSAVIDGKGAVVGRGVVNVRPGSGSIIYRITSYVIDGQGNMILAGPITQTLGNAPPVIGFTAFFAINADASKVTLLGFAPPALQTATQVLAFLGPPPAAVFQTPSAGNIVRHR